MPCFSSSRTYIRTFFGDGPAGSAPKLHVDVLDGIDEDVDCVVVSIGTSGDGDEELCCLFCHLRSARLALGSDEAAARPAIKGHNAIGSWFVRSFGGRPAKTQSRNPLLCIHHSPYRPCSHDAIFSTDETLAGFRVAPKPDTIQTDVCPTG